MVFTWGDGRRGQLGHGELETWRSRPHCVEALKVILINSALRISNILLFVLLHFCRIEIVNFICRQNPFLELLLEKDFLSLLVIMVY